VSGMTFSISFSARGGIIDGRVKRLVGHASIATLGYPLRIP